jgi:hypothetical protein
MTRQRRLACLSNAVDPIMSSYFPEADERMKKKFRSFTQLLTILFFLGVTYLRGTGLGPNLE